MRSTNRIPSRMDLRKIAAEDDLRCRQAAAVSPTPGGAGSPQTPAGAGSRKKSAAVREWLVISSSGRWCMEEAGRQSIMRRTGLPARDLRVLDPVLSYPSTILGRERAIMINLEHIKAIITATEVLIPNSKDPSVALLVQDLQSMVPVSPTHPQQANESNGMEREVTKTTSTLPSFPGYDGLPRPGTWISAKDHVPSQPPISSNELEESSPKITLDETKYGDTKVLPFEFRALEVCLEFACRCLELETSNLEKEAYPALDELTSKISTLNLEHVRQIKSRLVAISGRVQKVRDELEHLLDDDMDMAAMYLTEKLHRQPVGGASARFDFGNDAFELGEERDEEPKDEIEGSNESLDALKPEINELEMLLEAYFVQIDGTLNKVSTLREYVDDTEDYINIMLDDKQNQLLQMGVMISTASMVITMGIIVTGVLGINIHIPIYDSSYSHFSMTAGGICASIMVAYALAILLGKRSGLLQW